jgi:hypothetical protein
MKKLQLALFITVAIAALFSCKNSAPEAEWKKLQLGSMGISVDAPFSYQEKNMEAQLTPAVRQKIKTLETFVNEEKGNYYAVNIAEYAQDVNFSSEAAINGALSEMKMRAGAELSNRKDETKQINGTQAAITQATFSDKKNGKMELQMAILNKRNCMFQVICLYKDGDDNANKVATRIIESININ